MAEDCIGRVRPANCVQAGKYRRGGRTDSTEKRYEERGLETNGTAGLPREEGMPDGPVAGAVRAPDGARRLFNQRQLDRPRPRSGRQPEEVEAG